MKKQVLNFNFDYDYQIVGISCYLKDYRIAWLINKCLNINLIKLTDHIVTNNSNTDFQFSMYADRNLENETAYFLLANKTIGGFLLPEKKIFDYFLILENLSDFPNIYQEILQTLKTQKDIITIAKIDYDALKNKHNLIFE